MIEELNDCLFLAAEDTEGGVLELELVEALHVSDDLASVGHVSEAEKIFEGS